MSNPATAPATAEECNMALKIEYDTRHDRIHASMQAERKNDLAYARRMAAYARRMELESKLKIEFERKFEELKLKIAVSKALGEMEG